MKKAIAYSLAAVLLAASVSGSAHAAETGTISGTFIDRNGAPMANVQAAVIPWDQSDTFFGDAITDAAGHYLISGVPAGDYIVGFAPPDFPDQYAHSMPTENGALKVTVGNGTSSIVDEQLMPFATFTGRIANPDGTGASHVRVDFSGPYSSNTVTNGNGEYSFHTRPGDYRLSFGIGNPLTPDDYLVQFIPGKDVYWEGQLFHAHDGETLTVNDTVMPNGFIGGKFTDETGAALSEVGVGASRVDNVYGGGATTTDSNGNWGRRVKAGDYKVHFSSYDKGVYQYAYSKVTEAGAATISVRNGQTSTVNDSRLRSGSIRFTARDAVTGRTIQDFDATIQPSVGKLALHGNGVVQYAMVPIGTYAFSASGYGYQTMGNGTVTVTEGVETNVEISLQPSTRIDALVVDALTGQPVRGVCLFTGSPESFQPGSGYPCYQSGDDGRTMFDIRNDQPGQYQVFALPVGNGSQGYGAQWVGANGGTGNQLEAAKITVTAEHIANTPVIKLDRAATITGHVTAPNGGQVGPGTVSLAYGLESGYAQVTTDTSGNYSLSFLGPYAWPLRFAVQNWSVQYSGGTGNRFEAQRIQVTSGKTTVYNFEFAPDTRIGVKAPWLDALCELSVYNAVTGDYLGGYPPSRSCSALTLPVRVAAGQSVKLRIHYYDPAVGDRYVWHGGNSFATASALVVTNGGLSLTFVPGPLVPPRIDTAPDPTPVPVPRPTLIPSQPPVPRG